MSSPIEQALLDLAHHIDWPEPSAPTPDLQRRLAADPTRARSRHRWIPVTALLLVLVASLLLFSPRARQSVADLLGVAGIEITFDPDPAEYVSWEYCRGYADAVLSDG